MRTLAALMALALAVLGSGGGAHQNAGEVGNPAAADLWRKARSLKATSPAEAVRLLRQRANLSDCPAETAESAELLGDSLSAGGWLPEAAGQFRTAIDRAAAELSAARKSGRKQSKAAKRRAAEAAADRQMALQLKLSEALMQAQTPQSVEAASAPIAALMRQSDVMRDGQLADLYVAVATALYLRATLAARDDGGGGARATADSAALAPAAEYMVSALQAMTRAGQLSSMLTAQAAHLALVGSSLLLQAARAEQPGATTTTHQIKMGESDGGEESGWHLPESFATHAAPAHEGPLFVEVVEKKKGRALTTADVLRGQPLLLRGAVAHWPAAQVWQRQRLLTRYGSASVSAAAVAYPARFGAAATQTTLAEFVDISMPPGQPGAESSTRIPPSADEPLPPPPYIFTKVDAEGGLSGMRAGLEFDFADGVVLDKGVASMLPAGSEEVRSIGA